MLANNHLTPYVGKKAKINIGGPESRIGTIITVKGDHLVLLTDKEEVIYYKLDQVKSVLLLAKHENNDTDGSNGNRSGNTENDEDNEIDLTSVTTLERDFYEVLERFLFTKVRVNRGGPESAEGFVTDLTPRILEIKTPKEETVFFSISQIKSISTSPHKEKNNDSCNGNDGGNSGNSRSGGGNKDSKGGNKGNSRSGGGNKDSKGGNKGNSRSGGGNKDSKGGNKGNSCNGGRKGKK